MHLRYALYENVHAKLHVHVLGLDLDLVRYAPCRVSRCLLANNLRELLQAKNCLCVFIIATGQVFNSFINSIYDTFYKR